MNYELVLTIAFWVCVAASILWMVWIMWSLLRQMKERSKAMAVVYERKSNIAVVTKTVGFEVRLSRIPLPPPESRGHDEPFEWVMDKEKE